MCVNFVFVVGFLAGLIHCFSGVKRFSFFYDVEIEKVLGVGGKGSYCSGCKWLWM